MRPSASLVRSGVRRKTDAVRDDDRASWVASGQLGFKPGGALFEFIPCVGGSEGSRTYLVSDAGCNVARSSDALEVVHVHRGLTHRLFLLFSAEEFVVAPERGAEKPQSLDFNRVALKVVDTEGASAFAQVTAHLLDVVAIELMVSGYVQDALFRKCRFCPVHALHAF